jgi:energy-coupling factor transporter ATP-binding protein EcfA2
MSSKEFTLQKGLHLPVLKALNTLNKKSDLREIIDCISNNNLFVPRDGDLENIDFNDKVRYEYALEFGIKTLVAQGFIVLFDNLFEISQKGLAFLNESWPNYNHSDYIKKVSVINKNKYIYFNMPSHLLYHGHKQTSVLGFDGHESKYVKLLNDFIDYIDLNYPTVEEMINFLKYNYDFADDSRCLSAINVMRSGSLAKIIGKNLSLTKLGQWYINNYNTVALFRIFANRFFGFEEIFNTVAIKGNISKKALKESLLEKYNFDCLNDEQFDIRMFWLENMEIVKADGSLITLTNDSLELAEYLGVLDTYESKPPQKEVTAAKREIPVAAAKSAIQTLEEDDFHFSSELDNIIDDLISESVNNDNVYNEEAEDDLLFDSDFDDDTAPIYTPELFNNKNINLSQQERNFLLHNIDVESTLFSEAPQGSNDGDIGSGLFEEPVKEEILIIADDKSDEPHEFSEMGEDFQDLYETLSEVSVSQISRRPVLVHVTQKQDEIQGDIEPIEFNKPESKRPESTDQLYIAPDEINKLINLPREVVSKIVAALNMGKHLVLTGPHGSGKTSIAVILSKIAHQKGLNKGYNLALANDNWTSFDTIGGLIDIADNSKKIFKEGFILKSIRENKWLIVDEVSKCDTNKCFNDFINGFDSHNTILSYMHDNYKNIEIISEPNDETYDTNQYIKNKNWRMIATIDSSEMFEGNFSPALLRRFAFIEIGAGNYQSLIDEYFIKNNLQNDLLKTKIKSIFSENGLMKYKDVGASSIHDLIQYISIRSNLLSEEENMQDILAEGLELYILPQLKVLDDKTIKEIQAYLINLFEGYENIKKHISKAL